MKITKRRGSMIEPCRSLLVNKKLHVTLREFWGEMSVEIATQTSRRRAMILLCKISKLLRSGLVRIFREKVLFVNFRSAGTDYDKAQNKLRNLKKMKWKILPLLTYVSFLTLLNCVSSSQECLFCKSTSQYFLKTK